MKKLTIILLLICIFTTFTACGIDSSVTGENDNADIGGNPSIGDDKDVVDEPNQDGSSEDNSQEDSEVGKDMILKITVNNNVFTAKLVKNATVDALVKAFPMTIKLSDLNKNEKYYYLPNNLPTQNEKIDLIQSGDILLWGNNCLVLFYENFATSFSYTKIGKIENAEGLKNVLGKGDVTIAFSLMT